MRELPPIWGMIGQALNEWEGHISCVIFLAGCNLRCPFCHGHQFLEGPMDEIPFEQVEERIKRSEGWIDGVVVSGGEPTIHPQLPHLINSLRSLGVGIKLHSNGTNPAVLKGLLDDGVLDCLALDYKSQHGSNFQRASGNNFNPDLIKESYRLALKSGIPIEYHTTVCPQFVTPEILEKMEEELKDKTGTWYLQRYNPEDVLDIEKAGPSTYTLEELGKIANILNSKRSGIVKVTGLKG